MTNRVTIQIVTLIDALRQASYDPESVFDFQFHIENAKTPVEYARNVIVGAFLRSKCDKLWFIDEDMLPESSVARLVHHDADIVAARMYKFDHSNPETGVTVGLGLCAMTEKANGMFTPLITIPGTRAVQDADAVGTACTLIARHVIEDKRMWSDNVYTTIDGKTVDGNVDSGEMDYAPAIFRTPRSASGIQIIGEDLDFCKRARALGYSVMVDLNAVCGHFKTINIDQAGYLAQEVAQRVLNGVAVEDGRVMKFGFENREKAVEKPVAHRAVTREFTVRRGEQ